MPPLNDRLARLRRPRILDPKWQLGVSAGLAGTALGVGLLYLLGVSLVASPANLDDLSGRELGRMALIVNASYFLSVLVAVLIVTIRFTHSVAGPAMVLERAVRALGRGEFEERLSLRRRDYLKPLAAAIAELRQGIQQRNGVRNRIYIELEECLRREDLAGAQGLVKELRAHDPGMREKAAIERHVNKEMDALRPAA